MRLDEAAQERWLRRWALSLLVLVAALLLAETFAWRPGYAVGDESIQMRLLLRTAEGQPFQWRFLQGCLQRFSLQTWLAWIPFGMGSLHLPGLACFALELWGLWALACRWAGRRAAWGALIFILAAASTWMRVRSLLSFQWQPLLMIGLALGAVQVRQVWQAVLLGAAASLLLLDYEAGVLALPFVLWACAERESNVRSHLGWILLGAGLGTTALLAWQWDVVRAYAHLRATVNAGGAVDQGLLAAWGHNLAQLFMGGEPLGYLGVKAWPTLPPWGWIPLALGVSVAARRQRWGLLAWPLVVLLLTQCSRSPWGLSPHRLTAAWPALAILAGLGLERLLGEGSRRVQILVLCCLPLGFAGELSAWFHHMAIDGAAIYGRSARLQEAVDALSSPALGGGLPVLSHLYELRYPELRWHRRGHPTPLPGPSTQAVWVLLPPEYRVPAESLPLESRLWRRSPNEQGAWAVKAQGPLAARFIGMDRALAPLALQQASDLRRASDEDRAWLASPAAKDDWAWSAVLQRDLDRIWLGLPMEEAQWELYASRRPIQPGPDTKLGQAIQKDEPQNALRMYARALALDPDYTPALEARYKTLVQLGRDAEAQRAREDWRDRVAAGAWQVYQ